MKKMDRWATAVVAGTILAIVCILMGSSGGFTDPVVANNGTLTPTVWVYLPYVAKDQSATPTPTTIPAGVRILANHSSYVDSIDTLHIVGEIQNDTANHLRFVKVTANIFDSGGHLLDTDFTYTYLDNLPAGHKTCFHIILLDEPLAGLNLEEVEDMARFILDINEEERWQTTCVLVEHDMGVVMDISHRVMALNFGAKIAEGTPPEIQKNPHVIKAYLGEVEDLYVTRR